MVYFLGVDVGTYETKGCLIDEKLQIVKTAVRQHTLNIPRPGWAEHDANKTWWQDFVAVTQELLSKTKRKHLVAVACSAIAPTMLPVDRNGRPLRPAILYGIDTRAHREIEELSQILGTEWIQKHCWNQLSSQAVGPKILWFKKNEPNLYRKTWKIMTATSYLIFKLTGNVVIDFYTASSFTPLLDLNRLCWNQELSQLLVSPEKLPELKWTTEIAGTVTKDASAETGIPSGTPVIVGTADAAAEFVSTGAHKPGDTMIMLGSTVFFIEQTTQPAISKTMWTSVFLYPNTYCVAGGMATGGALTRWFRDHFATEEMREEETSNISAYEILWKRASQVPPGSSGILVLPYFSGERTPINDPRARGIIAGLTLAHSKYHLYRALLEGVAFGIRHNVEHLEEAEKVARVFVVGGGVKNPLWLEIISSVLNKTLLVPPVTIGASFGDALLAAMSQQVVALDDVENLFDEKYKTISPNQYWSKIYEEYYAIYLNLWNSIKEWVHKLANIGG
jgi:xylulokinase